MTHANEAHRWTDQLDDLCTRIAPASAASAPLSRFTRPVCLSEKTILLKGSMGTALVSGP